MTAGAAPDWRPPLTFTARRRSSWSIVVVVLLAASALLALAETSLVRTSRAKAMALVEDGRRGAKVLLRLVENPEGFLNPVLLLVLICQLVAATLVGILAADWFGAWGWWPPPSSRSW